MSNVEPLIEDWLAAKRALVLAAEKERQLRDSLVAALFPDAKRGTNKHTMEDGRVVKYVRGLNIKLTNPERDGAALVNLVNEHIPAGLVKVKTTFEVSESAYDKLSDEGKRFLSGALEVKDKAPTLSVD